MRCWTPTASHGSGDGLSASQHDLVELAQECIQFGAFRRRQPLFPSQQLLRPGLFLGCRPILGTQSIETAADLTSAASRVWRESGLGPLCLAALSSLPLAGADQDCVILAVP